MLIVNNKDLKSLNTKIDVNILLNLENIKKHASFSVDPGRFVCNYIYFLSLYFTQKVNETSIFIHVPSFQRMNFDIQLKCITCVIENIGSCFTLNV